MSLAASSDEITHKITSKSISTKNLSTICRTTKRIFEAIVISMDITPMAGIWIDCPEGSNILKRVQHTMNDFMRELF